MGGAAPADFASFVATYDHPLTAACQEITGNDGLAEVLRLDLLATAALRWRPWWRPARHRPRAAVRRLDRLLRREVRSYRLVPAPPGVPSRTSLSLLPSVSSVSSASSVSSVSSVSSASSASSASSVDGPGLVDGSLADAAWRRAGQLRRQALAGVAAAVVAIAGLALVGPHARAGPAPTPIPDVELPAGVEVLPDFAALARLPQASTALPPDLTPTLTTTPAARAVALVREPRGPLVVIGIDGQARSIDGPALAGARLLSTSLSPDGDRAVLVVGDALLTVDLVSGRTSLLPAGAAAPVLVWRTPHSVLIPGSETAREVDLDTGTATSVAGLTGVDVVNAEGSRNSPLTELLAVSSTAGQASRIRFWRTAPAAATDRDVEDRPTFGPQWIGTWSGPGWSSSMLFTRACAPGGIALPRRFDRARSAIGAVSTNGIYAGTLVATDDTTLEPLGFLQPQTILVAAYAAAATRVIAWTPTTGALQTVAAANTAVTVTVADLLPPS